MASLTERPSSDTSHELPRSLQLALAAARTAAENRGRDIVVLDMREATPIFDYFVLATGTSRRQLHAMSEEGKGGVLIGAHMGNWEIAGQLLERIKTPVNIVMLEAEHERIKRILDEVMVNKCIRVILQKSSITSQQSQRQSRAQGNL